MLDADRCEQTESFDDVEYRCELADSHSGLCVFALPYPVPRHDVFPWP